MILLKNIIWLILLLYSFNEIQKFWLSNKIIRNYKNKFLNIDFINRCIKNLNYENVIKTFETDKMPSSSDEFKKSIEYFYLGKIEIGKKRRKQSFFIILIISVINYFIKENSEVTSIIVFFIGAIIPSKNSKEYIEEEDIHTIGTIIHYWNIQFPNECKNYCQNIRSEFTFLFNKTTIL